LTAEHKVSTPVNWQQGEDVIISGSVSDEAAKEIWPEGWESPKPYIRIVAQPHCEPAPRFEGRRATTHLNSSFRSAVRAGIPPSRGEAPARDDGHQSGPPN
jgi:hypothetical protein